MTVVRNETQRHSATLKNAGQNPIGLFPLHNETRSDSARPAVLDGVGAVPHWFGRVARAGMVAQRLHARMTKEKPQPVKGQG